LLQFREQTNGSSKDQHREGRCTAAPRCATVVCTSACMCAVKIPRHTVGCKHGGIDASISSRTSTAVQTRRRDMHMYCQNRQVFNVCEHTQLNNPTVAIWFSHAPVPRLGYRQHQDHV
jgi:hypothetical protein